MRFHKHEYQPSVPLKKNQKKINKQKSYVQLKLAGFCQLTKFVHPVTLEPEVTGGIFLGLFTLIRPILYSILEGEKNLRP